VLPTNVPQAHKTELNQQKNTALHRKTTNPPFSYKHAGSAVKHDHACKKQGRLSLVPSIENKFARLQIYLGRSLSRL